MIAYYTAAFEDEAGSEWLCNNLGWHLLRQDYDAVVVPQGWQSHFDEVKTVIRSTWIGIPVYMLTHTPSGFRLDHVHVDERTLAMLHTAHANGYAVKAA